MVSIKKVDRSPRLTLYRHGICTSDCTKIRIQISIVTRKTYFIRFSHFDPQWTRRPENCFYKYFFFEQSQIILYHLIWAEKSEWFIKGFMGFCGYETFHHKIFWSSSLISFRGLQGKKGEVLFSNSLISWH